MSTTSGLSRTAVAPNSRGMQSQLRRAPSEPDRSGLALSARYITDTAEPPSSGRTRSTTLTPLALSEPVVWPPVQQQIPQSRLYDVLSTTLAATLTVMFAFAVYTTSMDTIASTSYFTPFTNGSSTFLDAWDPQRAEVHGIGPLVALKATRADVLAMLHDRPRFIDDLKAEVKTQQSSLQSFSGNLKARNFCKAEDVVLRVTSYDAKLIILLHDLETYSAAHRRAEENLYFRDTLGRKRLSWPPEFNGHNVEPLDKEAEYTRAADTLLAAVLSIDAWLSRFQTSWEGVNEERKALQSIIIEKEKGYDLQVNGKQPHFWWEPSLFSPEYYPWLNASRCQSALKTFRPDLRFSAEPNATDLEQIKRLETTLTRIKANLK